MAPAALPPAHHGANLVRSLRLRLRRLSDRQVTDLPFQALAGQGASENAPKSSFTDRTAAEISSRRLPWKQSPREIYEPTTARLNLPTGNWDDWRCHGDVKERSHMLVTGAADRDVSSNTVTNLQLQTCGDGKRVRKLQEFFR